jgi:hypothetical protein
MAKGDFVVRLVGDTKNYSSAMAQAKKSLEGFQQQNLSTNAVMKQITSTLGKYVSAAALVKGAQEAITRTIKGSQTTADAFSATMAAAKTSVDAFFTAISTGDFTAFERGLGNIIAQARDAQEALDRLGNANISWSYFFGAKQADFREHQRIVRDTTRPMDERQQALLQMKNIFSELEEYSKGYETRAIEAMAKEVVKGTTLSPDMISRAELEKVLRLDLLSLDVSAQEKERLQSRYKDFQSAVNNLPTAYTQHTYNGLSIREVDQGILEDNKKRLNELTEQYSDAIIYNRLLNQGSDEWLKSIVAMMQQADQAANSLNELSNSMREAKNSLKSTTTTTTALAPSTPVNLGGMYSAGIGGSVSSATPSTLPGLPQFYQLQIEQSAIDAIDAMTERTEQLASQAAGINSLANSFQNLGNSLMGGEEKWERVLGVILQIGGAAMSFFGSGGASGILSLIGGMFGGSAMGNGIGSLIGGLSFASGGIVPGSNYYDGITARVSSGEMIINEADQKRLFDSIHTGNIGGGGGPARVTGEQIILAINNYGRRTGRGELLFG